MIPSISVHLGPSVFFCVRMFSYHDLLACCGETIKNDWNKIIIRASLCSSYILLYLML